MIDKNPHNSVPYHDIIIEPSLIKSRLDVRDFHILVERHQLNFDPVSFHDSEGNELEFEVDEKRIWVKVPFISATNDTTIRCYSGGLR